ncbi:MAG: phage/plasmid primase, P4 family [Candidatus Hydrogenedentota bacterium]
MTGSENGNQLQEEIRRQVEARVQEEAAALPQKDKEIPTLESGFVLECLEANELGDGILYAIINRDRYLYDPGVRSWFSYVGHHYELDSAETHLHAVERVADIYLTELRRVGEEKVRAAEEGNKEGVVRLQKLGRQLTKRIFRLRTDTGRAATVKFARTCEHPLVLKDKAFDAEPSLLPCINGVINLESGKFREGRPTDLLSKACPVQWGSLDEPCPGFEKWLLEILDGDEAVADYLQRFLGYAITGLRHEHVFSCWCGRGRNGKGTLVDVLNGVLGPLAGPIRPELLLQDRTTSANQSTPALMGLKGLRLAFASETDEARRFSPAAVKRLTGGDALIGRGNYDRLETRWTPTHTLILLTNSLPGAPPDDFAFWERMRLIRFPLSFVDRDPSDKSERRARKGLADQLAYEASGILAWLVRGCLRYQREGLHAPEAVTKATAEYRRSEDMLADFLEAHCLIGEHFETRAADAYKRFSSWFEENISSKGLSQSRFGRAMAKKFHKRKSSGVFVYEGFMLRPLCVTCERSAVLVDDNGRPLSSKCPDCKS